MRLALCALTYCRTRKAEFVTSVGYLWKTRVYRFHNSRKRVELAMLAGAAEAMKRLGRGKYSSHLRGYRQPKAGQLARPRRPIGALIRRSTIEREH
jgi:hypothetical protein